MNNTEDIIAYILSKLGKSNTFRLSRILLMLDFEWEKRHGKRRTALHYGLFPPAFYVEEFPDMLLNAEGIEKVMEKDENGIERGVFLYHGEVPELDGETKELLDSIIERTNKMDDHTLNSELVNSEEYRKALEKSSS